MKAGADHLVTRYLSAAKASTVEVSRVRGPRSNPTYRLN